MNFTKKIKPIANVQSKMTQKLIELLNELEDKEYLTMSNNGKICLDKIWKLLRMPTNEELLKALAKKESIDSVSTNKKGKE